MICDTNDGIDKTAVCVQRPLCVDLDGTLVRSDLLMEGLLSFLKQAPWSVFSVLLWLMQGRAYLKVRLSAEVKLDVAVLPYCTELLDYLHAEQRKGRLLVLVTAAPIAWAHAVADYWGIFSEVITCAAHTNLKGASKAHVLEKRFGSKGYAYAGNAHCDLQVWQASAEVIVVNPHLGVASKVQKMAPQARFFEDRIPAARAWVMASRPQQWIKNVLIFVPLIASHRIFEPFLILHAFWAFVALSLVASSAYMLNDLLDLEADRHHFKKRYRPFACGALRIEYGLLASILLLIASVSISIAKLNELFMLCMGGYYLITVAYSLSLKKIVILDVLTLAGLYTFRIVAGAVATQIRPTAWLLAFSVFLFTSLAFVKRFEELHRVHLAGRANTKGRGYYTDDLVLLEIFGIVSGYMSVLVLALYIQAGTQKSLYTHPEYIWFLCPILMYWISRVWIKTHRNEMHYDPVVFPILDPVSRLLLVLAAGFILLAL